jgi:hypothetical protein
MKVNVGDPFYVFTYENKIKGSHSIEVDYFAAFTDPIEDIRLNPEDHSEYKWLSESEFKGINSKDRNKNDPEITAIKKGFSLLKGKLINFA